MDTEEAYIERYPILERVSKLIYEVLKEILQNAPRVDAISARAKSVQRFVEKANRIGQDGKLKYEFPLQDIQDQIGARVVVFYLSDVEVVANHILQEFRVIENRNKEGAEPDRFGYEAKHFVCFVPLDILEKTKCPVNFFELQVSTLFQHAWAEANHDLGYKPGAPLAYDNKRKIAFAAAQAWGADSIFDELWRSRKTN